MWLLTLGPKHILLFGLRNEGLAQGLGIDHGKGIDNLIAHGALQERFYGKRNDFLS